MTGMVMKYGVVPPPTGDDDLAKRLHDLARDTQPESQAARLRLLEQKVAVLTLCVEQLLKERKERVPGIVIPTTAP